MTIDPCAQVRSWLVAGESGMAAPSAALAAHVMDCPRCRGSLVAILATIVAPPPADAASCDACFEDLPAYVEGVQAQGVANAAQRYPHIWWHLWTCPECAASAENITLLLAAEATGLIDRPPTLLPKRQHTTLPPIRLGRSLLHGLFGPQIKLGARWHSGSDPLFLAEHTLPECQVSIYVHQTDAEHWDLEITVEPPIIGSIIVSFGDLRYCVPLLQGRVAQVKAIPAALLAGQTGPDMQIAIECEYDDGVAS